MKQLLVLICLLVASLDASAQNWFRTAGPVEDEVLDLCIDSNGILYAVTPLGVNRSIDGGAKWTRPFLFPQVSSVSCIIVALNGNIIAGASSGIFVSRDSGNTFIRSDSFLLAIPVLQFARTGTGRIFATGLERAIYSDNNGESWTELEATTEYLMYDVPSAVAAFKNRVIMQGEYQTYSSLNNGATWNELEKGERVAAQAYKLLIRQNGVWVSLDVNAGLNRFIPQTGMWEPYPGASESAFFFNADCLLDGSMLVSSNEGVFQVKGTSTWVDVTSGFPADVYKPQYSIPRFTENPQTGIYYAATSSASVWKSAAVLQHTNVKTDPLPLSVSPNPFTSRTKVTFTANETSWSALELRNILGVVVWKQGRELCPPGTSNLPIAVHGIPPGNYLLVLRTVERTESQWVTIVK